MIFREFLPLYHWHLAIVYVLERAKGISYACSYSAFTRKPAPSIGENIRPGSKHYRKPSKELRCPAQDPLWGCLSTWTTRGTCFWTSVSKYAWTCSSSQERKSCSRQNNAFHRWLHQVHEWERYVIIACHFTHEPITLAQRLRNPTNVVKTMMTTTRSTVLLLDLLPVSCVSYSKEVSQRTR